MKAIFLGYKGGHRTQKSKCALIRVDGVDNRSEAAAYIGRKVLWISPSGSRLIGEVVGVHGRNGVLKVRFRKGLPGEAIGTELTIM